MARKYIYGEQFAQKLPGSNQNFYFRTVTTYEVDNNGNPIEGTAGTNLYYAPKPAARTSDGKTWTAGTTDSIDNFDQGGWVVAGLTADGGKTYIFERYTQEDADVGRIPPGKNVGDPVLGATAQQSLSTSGGRFYEAVQNNLINLAANTQSGLAQVVSAKQKNTVQQQQQQAAAAATGLTPAQQAALNNVQIIDFEFQGKSRDKYGNYYYPLSIKDNKQDVIRFSIKKPGKVTFNPRFGEKTITRTYSETFGSVTLPIQPTISDSNTVDWSGLQLNALEAYAAGASISLASSQTPMELFDKGGFMLKDIVSKLTTDQKYKTALNVAIAQEAVGIQGLLSRATGGILNPNLELLFNGPQLRAFSFTFKMSPRSEKEATQVRNIIRFFKQGMSVKRTSSEVFLKSPHVFDVEYKTYDANGVEKKHPSINKIKTCALVGCDVDYTPDGTYMTFNDASRTMTSYQMSLRFSELEPIYDNDYNVFANDDIGY